MGDTRVQDRLVDNLDNANSARDRLADAAHSERIFRSLSDYGVDRQRVGDKDDYTIFTQYPNGVRMARIEARGVLSPGGSYELEPPFGGTKKENEDGTEVIKDASGKVVAELDADKTLHVYTKNGDYTETKNGKVKFTPADGVTDLKSLHKDGKVSPKNYEDYGISGYGEITRFPNGLEVDRATGNYKIPEEQLRHATIGKNGKASFDYWSESQNVKKDYDAEGNLTKVTVTGADGKVLFTKDAKGIHVPTPDGELHQKANGSITFESNQTASAAKVLPEVEIAGGIQDVNRRRETPEEALKRCAGSSDPLCGIEDDLNPLF